MRERRFLVSELTAEPEVQIRGPEAHHLLHVLRLRPGDEVVLFDGKGLQFRAVITRCENSYAVVEKLERLAGEESPLKLHLAVAVPKGDKMSLIVRMLTELGVSELTPLITERTNVRSLNATQEKKARWDRIAVDACKQSGRSRLLEVNDPVLFPDLFGAELPDWRILVCPHRSPLTRISESNHCLALIGPEGGWTEAEIESAVKKGFKKLGLGPRTLRVDTAAVTTAAILQWSWGDLHSLPNS